MQKFCENVLYPDIFYNKIKIFKHKSTIPLDPFVKILGILLYIIQIHIQF